MVQQDINMSGKDFVTLLERINYPKVHSVDGSSFDWMFENEAVVPFLNWLCDEVGSNNLLSEKELNQYKEIEDSSEGVLEGKQLEEALHSIITLEEDTLSEERLQEEIAELETELQLSKKRKDLMVQQRNVLSLHHTALTDKVYHLTGLENEAKVHYKEQLEESQSENTKLNGCLEGLCGAVSSLTDLYLTPTGPSPLTTQDCDVEPTRAMFLSQLPLDHYHDMEERFSQVLTAYTKKLFFKGISEMAGKNEKTRYDFLEISKPETLLVHGQAEQVILEDCKELARLQAFYPKSEACRINAKLQQKGLEAACSYTERKLQALKESPYPKDSKHLKDVLDDSDRLLSVIRLDENKLTGQELPELLKECANSWLTQILCGDYDLKIARQNYFTSNQDKVISELIGQRCRNEFLTMAYEMEDRSHREIHRLLTALNMLLKRNSQTWTHRMSLLKEPVLSTERHHRNTIDSRDKYLTRLSSVLGCEDTSSDKQLFITHNQLTSQMAALSDKVSSLNASLSATNSNQDHRLKQLEKSLEHSRSLVYSGSSTSIGQPSLSSQPINDALTQLEALLKKLEQAVLDIRKDVDHKKKILKTDRLQCVERELFVDFHTDQDTLRRLLDDLQARLNAQMVH